MQLCNKGDRIWSRLGDTELAIMLAVWGAGEPMQPDYVHRHLRLAFSDDRLSCRRRSAAPGGCPGFSATSWPI